MFSQLSLRDRYPRWQSVLVKLTNQDWRPIYSVQEIRFQNQFGLPYDQQDSDFQSLPV